MSASDLANAQIPLIKANIKTRIDNLNTMSPPPQDIIDKYNALDREANNIQTSISSYTLMTIGPVLSDLQSKLTTLNIETARAVRKGGSGIMGDIFEEIKQINSDLFVLVSTLVGMFFGGIVTSNWYVGKVNQSPAQNISKLQILFYFIYGGILFPFALLYGALIDTPAWRSILIPLYEVPTGLYNPLISYRPKTTLESYSIGKNVLKIACYILLICLSGTIYLINFNQ